MSWGIMKSRNIKGNIFLYRRVQNHLEKLMQQGVLKANEKIPGERVLSKSLDVSRDTIRNALRALEDDGFLVRIPAKGTFIREIAAKKELNIAFVFPTPEISPVFQDYDNYTANSDLWRGIVSAGAQAGVAISFLASRAHAPAKDAKALADKLMRSFDGVIFPSPEFTATARILDREGFPCIHCCQSEHGKYVYYNRAEAVHMAAAHLISCGCKNVLLLGKGNPATSTWGEKISVFRREFAANGTPIPDENIITVKYAGGKILINVNKYFDRHPEVPDAVFCASPALSLALFHIAGERNWQIPEKVQICGYANNAEHRNTLPELTYIQLPHAEIGMESVRLLVEKLRNNTPIPEKTLLPARLVLGETMAKNCNAEMVR